MVPFINNKKSFFEECHLLFDLGLRSLVIQVESLRTNKYSIVLGLQASFFPLALLYFSKYYKIAVSLISGTHRGL